MEIATRIKPRETRHDTPCISLSRDTPCISLSQDTPCISLSQDTPCTSLSQETPPTPLSRDTRDLCILHLFRQPRPRPSDTAAKSLPREGPCDATRRTTAPRRAVCLSLHRGSAGAARFPPTAPPRSSSSSSSAPGPAARVPGRWRSRSFQGESRAPPRSRPRRPRAHAQ
jgi:hypothetical protein